MLTKKNWWSRNHRAWHQDDYRINNQPKTFTSQRSQSCTTSLLWYKSEMSLTLQLLNELGANGQKFFNFRYTLFSDLNETNKNISISCVSTFRQYEINFINDFFIYFIHIDHVIMTMYIAKLELLSFRICFTNSRRHILLPHQFVYVSKLPLWKKTLPSP